MKERFRLKYSPRMLALCYWIDGWYPPLQPAILAVEVYRTACTRAIIVSCATCIWHIQAPMYTRSQPRTPRWHFAIERFVAQIWHTREHTHPNDGMKLGLTPISPKTSHYMHIIHYTECTYIRAYHIDIAQLNTFNIVYYRWKQNYLSIYPGTIS